ncbi:MAG: c-type cytochrome [Candidatus Neomarinimicrobiota bacterium]
MEKRERHERYYNIFKLNRLFGISSLVFLLLLVWTFADDYSRGWRSYQRKFRQLEISRTSGLLEEEIEKLSTSDEYGEIEKKLRAGEESLKDKEKELGALGKQIRTLENDDYKAQQEYNFVKADYDVTKYLYEEAVAEDHADSEVLGEELARLEQDLTRHRLQVEEVGRYISQKRDSLRSHEQHVKELKDKHAQISRRKVVLTRKLRNVDPSAMSMGNRIANWIRDLPVLDFLSPYYKVDQVVLKDITEDINFTQVPRVDRCTSCHLGIAQPGYEDAPQPYTTHSDLELYVSNESPHPFESFGCTSCHAGRGRGTDFVSSVHSPNSSADEERWKDTYGWHRAAHWDEPMFPVKYAEAGCFKCHSEEIFLKGADKLNLGTNLIERAGCFGCHTIERYKDKRRIGPDLNKIGSKVSRDWAYLWIRDPKSFRHNTWMPRLFGLSNNSDPEDIRRADQGIHAIVHFLLQNSSEFPLEPMRRQGDPQRGRDLVNSVGCLGCHRMESEPSGEETSLQTLRRDHGPNLIGLGSKSSPLWVFNWLKEPERYFPETKMPNLRLTDREASDITAFLMTTSNGEFLEQEIPPLEEGEIDGIVLNFLGMMYSDHDSRQKLSAMTLEEKLDYSGEKLIRHYGCFGCHNIPGFEEEKPIGTELTEEGSKSVEELDFGFIDLEHSKTAWFRNKIKYPRSFDRHKIKGPYEKLRMPNFEFRDEEADAIVTALLGFVRTSYGVKPKRSENPDVHMGQWLVREYNCQGCHIIEGDGAAIRPTVTQWLMEANGIGEAQASTVTPDFSPPDLHTQGSKTQPKWLFNFLKSPGVIIRPNLRVRMPAFRLTDSEWNSIIKYFQFLEEKVNAYESPHLVDVGSSKYGAGTKLEKMGECNKCHFYGKTFPSQDASTWAANLVMVKDRLRPEWVSRWLSDPQRILPGTKMPTPYIPTEEDIQIPEAEEIFGKDIVDLAGDRTAMVNGLRDYLYTLSGKSDITAEIMDYFDANGYEFFEPEVEEEDIWEDWE